MIKLVKYVTKHKAFLTGALVALLISSIGLAIGAAVIGAMSEYVEQLPSNGFTILDKKQVDDSFLWMHHTLYYFQYGNKSASWVQVPLGAYVEYDVGDFYNGAMIWEGRA
jgi:hypothetical protein